LGGRVETVATFALHRLRLFFSTMGSWTCIGHARPVRARVACYILGHPRCRSAAGVRRRSTSIPMRAVRAARPSAPREHTGARQGDDGTDGGACNGGRGGGVGAGRRREAAVPLALRVRGRRRPHAGLNRMKRSPSWSEASSSP
jgi:hypothetical protein